MPPADITKPEVIKFLVESYDKTARLRMRWNVLHEENVKQTAKFTGDEKGYTISDVSRSVLEAGMPATTRENINAQCYRYKQRPHDGTNIYTIKDLKKEHSIPKVGLGDPKEDPRLVKPDNDLSFDPKMRPVPMEQSNMIYNGLPDYGRVEYLKVRNRTKPEDKYYFQETMGWQYGWRLKDSYFGKSQPKHPRMGLLRKSLINRTNSLKPDPENYQNPKALLGDKVTAIALIP